MAFERYCDDAVIHCSSQEQAVMVRDALAARLAEVGLELHPDKTRVVYCKDADRRGDHEVTSFTFLGYTFRPRLAKNRWGKHFVSFLPAVSEDAVKAMSREIRSWHIARRSDKSLTDLAQMFNSIVQGMGELLPVRHLQGNVQRGRPLHLGPADALDTRQVRGETPARDERAPPSLLRPGVEVRLQRGRLHRRIQRRHQTLPLPRQQHPDPMDPGTSSRHQQLTSGQDTRSARCAERCTPGAGGDLRETDWWQHQHRARGSTSPGLVIAAAHRPGRLLAPHTTVNGSSANPSWAA